jgi:hypothetical protein
VSTTVSLVRPAEPLVQLDDVGELGATLVFSTTGVTPGIAVQIGSTPDLADAAWQPLVSRWRWDWSPEAPRVVWVRFREPDGLMSEPRAFGPDAPRLYLPLIRH